MSMGLFCSGKSASYACSDVLNCCAVQSCNNTELPSCLHQFPKPATKYPVNIENFTSPAGNDTHCDTKADWGACEIDFFFEFTGCCKSKGDEDTSEGYFQVPTADTESLSASLAMHPFSVLPLDPHGGPIETPGETNSGLSASNSASPTLPAAQNSVTLTLSVSQNSVASTPVLGSLPTRTLVGQTVSQTTKSSNTAAVAGGIAGGIVGLALLLAVLAICYRQRITRLLKGTDQGKLATWGSGQARATGAGGRELEEIKQGPSPSNYTLFPQQCDKLTISCSIFTSSSTLTLAFTSTTRLHTLQTARQ